MRKVIIGCIGIYILIVIWGLLSEGTWDDDCPTRYYQVKNAFNDPKQFVSTWNRPLFTVLYVLPLQFGKKAVIFETAAISTLAGFFVYLVAREYLNYAWMVIPFISFQAFYFPVSFNALSEPLAALLLSMGIYFYKKKQDLGVIVCGSLLPLARLELSVLVIIFAVAIGYRSSLSLFLRKSRASLKYIPILILPILIWNFAGWMFYDDPLWLIHTVFKGEPNKYGHQPFLSYFHRYIYLTGPVVFYFLMIGLFERIRRVKFDFTLVLFSVGFMIYVLLSWKFSIGQPAGFMRHLIPLSPLAGLLALEGYNTYMEKKVIPYSIVILFMVGFFFSTKLVIHHIVGDEPEYYKLAIVSLLSLLNLL